MRLKLSPGARFGFDRLLDDGLTKARALQKRPKLQVTSTKINSSAHKRPAVATKAPQPQKDLGQRLLSRLKPVAKTVTPSDDIRKNSRCIRIAVK